MPYTYGGSTYADITDADAGRFLSHATMGHNYADITALKTSPQGYHSWVEQQFTIKDTSGTVTKDDASIQHFSWVGACYKPTIGGSLSPLYTADQETFKEYDFTPQPFISSFIRKIIKSNNLLRLKTAYALSQLLVVSGASGLTEAMVYRRLAGYMDLLEANAFTSYEAILKAVSRNIVMSEFLTFKNSSKEANGQSPDENYAREVLQLFSLGVVALDTATGKPVIKTVVDGKPVFYDSYDTNIIKQVARIFTGWVDAFDMGTNPDDPPDNDAYRGADLIKTSRTGVTTTTPGNMGLKGDSTRIDSASITITFPTYTNGVKDASGYTISVASGSDPEARINSFISQLMRHPSVAHNISKQLIQRFTASNPNARYLSRVVTAFKTPVNNQIGDMKSVLRAILLDSSFFLLNGTALTRTGLMSENTDGKIREPFIRLTNWARAFSAKCMSPDHRDAYAVGTERSRTYNSNNLGQAPLCAPSVFNFYRPGYVAPNSKYCAQTSQIYYTAGQYNVPVNFPAPELQITTGAALQSYANYIYQCIRRDMGVGSLYKTSKDKGLSYGVISTYDDLLPLASSSDVNPLLDRINALLAVNGKKARTTILNRLSVLPRSTAEEQRNLIEEAVFMTMVSPEYLVAQ